MKKVLLFFVLTFALSLPFFAFASITEGPPSTSVDSFVSLATKIAELVWLVFTVIAVIMFVVAGILFLTANGEAQKLTQARSAFLWGIAGIVVAIMAFGIITLVGNIL